MKIFKAVIMVVTLTCISPYLYSHEGHGPKQVIAPHGGVLFDGKKLMGEMVAEEAGIRLYFLDHDSKVIPANSIAINDKAMTLTDSKKKPVKYELVKETDSIALKFDKSTSHRYTLTVPATYKKSQETLKWNFEPQ